MPNFGDVEAVVRAKTDSTALEELIRSNTRFLWAVVQKFSKEQVLAWRGLTVEDLYQEAVIGLIKAVKSYNPAIASFSTWAWTVIYDTVARNCRVMKYRRAKDGSPENVLSLSTPIAAHDTIETDDTLEEFISSCVDLENEVIAHLDLARAFAKLTETQRSILKLKMLGYTHEEISRMRGVSHQTICDTYRRAVRRLRNALGA